jgi:predicted AAA+ superfamily ATPase
MAAVPRSEHLGRVRALLRQSPVVALLGARQVGKSTLARELAAERKGAVRFFDLEDSRDVLETPRIRAVAARDLLTAIDWP